MSVQTQLAWTPSIVSLLLLGRLHIASALHVCIGTRPSPLACTQAEACARALQRAEPSMTYELVRISSTGDQPIGSSVAASTLAQGEKVDFTGLLDDAVIKREIDVAVHSLKDLPPLRRWKPGLAIGYHSARENPYDVLVGAESVAGVPLNARVGSSSVRRQAQLLAMRPDVTPVNLRGNVKARLDALDGGEVDVLVLAKAGLDRLGLSSRCQHELSSDEMLPACGQGIVCAVCRTDQTDLLRLLHAADDRVSRIAAAAELAFLSTVDGAAPWEGRPPLAAHMKLCEDSSWLLSCLLARPDGARVLRTTRHTASNASEEQARALGVEAGEELLRLAGAHFFFED